MPAPRQGRQGVEIGSLPRSMLLEWELPQTQAEISLLKEGAVRLCVSPGLQRRTQVQKGSCTRTSPKVTVQFRVWISDSEV